MNDKCNRIYNYFKMLFLSHIYHYCEPYSTFFHVYNNVFVFMHVAVCTEHPVSRTEVIVIMDMKSL